MHKKMISNKIFLCNIKYYIIKFNRHTDNSSWMQNLAADTVKCAVTTKYAC
jgi:hypothetical protein